MGLDDQLDQAKGKLKQAAGDVGDDDELRREGKRDEAAGEAKEGLDNLKDKAKGLVDDAKDALNRD